MGYMGHWPILRAHHHFGQGLSLFLFKLYLFLWVILVWVCEPVYSDQPQSESYTKISLHTLDFTEMTHSQTPPPPPSKFYKKPNSRALILFRCTKLRKWEPVYPSFQSQWELWY